MAPRPIQKLSGSKTWPRHSKIRYCFLKPTPWSTPDTSDVRVIKAAISDWLQPGCTLQFEETERPDDAHVRIATGQGSTAIARVGTDALDITDPAIPTLQFSKPLSGESGQWRALHEIGHVLGFEHEHQSRNAAIDWDLNALKAALSNAPPFWTSNDIERQIVSKNHQGRHKPPKWDPSSIMQYALPAGVIRSPATWRDKPIPKAKGLSAADIDEFNYWYA